MSLSGGCAESVMMPGLVIDMEEARLQTIEQVRAFLDGATEIAFRVAKAERYPFIERVLTRFGYASQGRIGAAVPPGGHAVDPAWPAPARLSPPLHRQGRGLRPLLEGFPFFILGFHADNGSEYINYKVAIWLEKLRIECTKSRPQHSTDTALAESKHGAVVRQHLRSAHIPQPFATPGNAFCANHLTPYVNVHRPCVFPETITDARGTERKRDPYRDMQTPYEKVKSIPDVRQYLTLGITVEQ